MEKFAILHNTEKYGQVLITKEYDLDEETYKIKTQFNLKDEVMASFNVEIKSEEVANKVFEDYENEETAIKPVKKIIDEFNN